MNPVTKKFQFGDFEVSMETGKVAKQATGSVVVTMGDTVAVEGVVMEMGELTLVAWSTAETISETDRIVAEFATHYIEAERVDVSGAAGGADDSGADGAGAGEGEGN